MGRILVVASDYPYPPNHGSAVHTWSLILGLRELGFAVDLIVTVRSRPSREHIDAVQAIVEQMWVIERKRVISAALSLIPFQVRSREALQNVALSTKYEAVLLKSDYVARILENAHLDAGLRILIADGEARYFRDLSNCADSWWKRCFYRAEAVKFERFSPQIRSKCDLLWFVSDWERTLHLRKHPTDHRKAIFLPPDPGVARMCPYSADGTEALFIGSLAIPLNLQGLQWYIKTIHPTLSKIQGYSLTIAGRTDGSALPGLEKMLERFSNISLCADPQELSAFYKRAAVFVNPVRRGAGIKLKTIHALQAGVPVVSTSIGMEGTGLVDGKHLLVADSSDDFAHGVATLLRDRSLARRLVHSAQSFLAENYDQQQNLRRSLSSVLSLQSASGGRGTKKKEEAACEADCAEI